MSDVDFVIGSVFHPSGQVSITMVRDLLRVLPGAVVVTDAETTEVLAYSPAALALFEGEGDQLFKGIDFHVDRTQWADGLKALEQAPDKVMRVAHVMQTFRGNKFPALLRFRLTEMAGRRVFISSIERGLPDPDIPAVGLE